MDQEENLRFEHGNQWVRADFHLHTKSDKEFKYTGEENSYINSYVEKLKAEKIDLGVIANHNKFDKDEFKNLRKKARKLGIGLLPGVELSVNDGANGVHLLVIFSEDWLADGQDYINSFLSVTFAGKTPSQYEQENGRSNDDLIATLKTLEGFNKKFLVVFAHVEQPSGLWIEIAGGRMQELAENQYIRRYCKGFQKVRTFNSPQKISREKVMGWWKDAYPAEVEGSDPKAIDQIGRGEKCYLNIGDYSFDAVSYALTDHRFRVSKSIELTQHSYINAIRFEGGLLNNVRIPFSPGLNCLIGIRGSGKSTILESIRYVLNIPMGDSAQDKKYKDSLLPYILKSGGKITIEAIDRHGSKFEVSRILNSSPDIYSDGKHIPNTAILSTIISNPLYFGQKDLSAAGEEFGHDLVEKIVRDLLVDARKAIKAKVEALEKYVDDLSAAKTESDQLSSDIAELESVKFQLEQFDKYGIQEHLTKQVDFENDVQYLTLATSSIEQKKDSFILAVSDFFESIELIKDHKSHSNQLKIELFINLLNDLKLASKNLNPYVVTITEKFNEVKKVLTDMEFEKEGLKEQFAEIERNLVKTLEDQGLYSVKPSEYIALSSKKTELEANIDILKEKSGRAAELSLQLLTGISELNLAWHAEFKIIQLALDKINNAQNSLLIEAVFKGDKSFLSRYLDERLKGGGIRKDSYELISQEYLDFGEIYKDIDRAKNLAKSKAEEFKAAFLRDIKEFITCQIPNNYNVTYRGKPLRSHSLGQRASAMMLFILSQKENDLLLIDQPEDDLDNQTIYDDVVKIVKALKPSQQFIFATHNANFPVLGDANQLVSCELADNKIDIHVGSIDDKQSQLKIVKVMEGGAEAFNRRKSIYQIWEADI